MYSLLFLIYAYYIYVIYTLLMHYIQTCMFLFVHYVLNVIELTRLFVGIRGRRKYLGPESSNVYFKSEKVSIFWLARISL